MTVPQEVKLARHAGDLDDDGHDEHIPPLADDGDMLYLGPAVNVATVGEGASIDSYSSYFAPYVPANVIDEDDLTVWAAGSGDSGQFVVVDLGAVRTIVSWRLLTSTTGTTIPTSWQLYYLSPTYGYVLADTIAGGAGGDYGIRAITPAAAQMWRIQSVGSVSAEVVVGTFEVHIAPSLLATPSQEFGRSILDTADQAEAQTLLGITSGAPTTADYLVGTSQGGLSSEIVVGTTPGGQLAGTSSTWAVPVITDSHGSTPSTHASTQAAAEATAAAALAAALLALPPSHVHVVGETHLSDGSTTTYTLDGAFEPGSVEAFNTTTLAYLTVTETQPDQATVSAAGSSGDKITFSYAASLA